MGPGLGAEMRVSSLIRQRSVPDFFSLERYVLIKINFRDVVASSWLDPEASWISNSTKNSFN
jgi:hypothetical protein